MNTSAEYRGQASHSMEDIELQQPSYMMRSMLYVVAVLIATLLIWAIWGRLDIIASAEGRLIPQTFVKIVQPADAGVVQEILVKEGQRVHAGQVLMRMDSQSSDADLAAMQSELSNKRLQLRRIDAELDGVALSKLRTDPPQLFLQIDAQHQAHRKIYADNLAQEQELLRKVKHELTASRETQIKMEQSVPILQNQAQSYARLGNDGFFPALQVQEKLREYQERAQDLKAQESTVRSLEAAIAQSQKRLEQVTSNYRSNLHNERVEAEGQFQRLHQEWLKLQHKSEFLELKAPQGGFVKDLSTHTAGTVVAPGTILLTLVPEDEPLVAEVQIKNDDVGFVHLAQSAKIKLMAYPFQKYGMVDGVVTHIDVDAQDNQAASKDGGVTGRSASQQSYKVRVSLDSQILRASGETLKLISGMQVIAEINQGQRSVLEYLLSPVQQVVHDSARER